MFLNVVDGAKSTREVNESRNMLDLDVGKLVARDVARSNPHRDHTARDVDAHFL